MVKLPVIPTDLTLAASDAVLVQRSRKDKFYGKSIGMGAIGDECSRKLWYAFRLASGIQDNFDAGTLKVFEDGHYQEDLQAKRLRMVDGITLITEEPSTGKQIKHLAANGHLKGFQDGDILGLLEAPNTWHVWEHKAVGEKKWAKLRDLKMADEKSALERWDVTYYAQAVLYMYLSGHKRHYLTCSTPGGRQSISVRTNANTEKAKALIRRAENIINSDKAPARPFPEDYYACNWCAFKTQCHLGSRSDRNCRTCLHSSPVEDGKWHCAKHDGIINYETQPVGCEHQRYLPDLVPGKQVDADEEKVSYLIHETHETWEDRGPGS